MGSERVSSFIKMLGPGLAKSFVTKRERREANLKGEAQAQTGIATRQTAIAEDERKRRLRLLQTPVGAGSFEQFTGRKTLLGQ
jgi:hypothetical protein